MTFVSSIPTSTYGALLQDSTLLEVDAITEQIRHLGYAIIDSCLSPGELEKISESFNKTYAEYVQKWGSDHLRSIDEYHTIRALLTQGDPIFMQLAANEKLMGIVSRLIVGKFILNQQNGIINPPGEHYSQGSWHRDLPYQHFTSSSPLAINALFCVDDFTLDNGSTFVLPATHKIINCPSANYIHSNAVQLEAKAGQFILLDCMLFHSGGFNRTNFDRRAINHVYTIPYFKQQIKLSGNIDLSQLTPFQKDLIGLNYQEPLTLEKFLISRCKK